MHESCIPRGGAHPPESFENAEDAQTGEKGEAAENAQTGENAEDAQIDENADDLGLSLANQWQDSEITPDGGAVDVSEPGGFTEDVENVVTAWALGLVDQIRYLQRRQGLSGRDFAAMVLVGSHPDGSMDWLQRRLGLTQSGTVRLIDRLAAANLLRRQRAGRSMRLALTGAGQHVLAELTADRRAVVRSALGGLSDADRGTLGRLVGRMLASTRRARADADTTCRWCDWSGCTEGCPVDRSVTAE